LYGHHEANGLTDMTTSTATDVKHHLDLLYEERVLAIEIGLAADGAYMADLDEEIAAYRSAFVGAAVTEIASMRAQLSGPFVG
jgi:hypothetical protein